MKSHRNALLAALFLCGSTAAHAGWRKFETAHFIIYSESNDKRVNELASGLEQVDGLMRMATGLREDGQPVKVRIYEMADEGQVEAAFGEYNSGVAGFYTSNILGPYAVTLRKAYNAEGSFTGELVLHHEYAHHFMLQYFPATYPGWYIEGFAELVGSSKELDDGRIAYGFPAKHRGGWIGADWTDVGEILLKPPEKVRFDPYGQGWAMTHYLTFSKERSPQLRRYLAALSAGKSPDQAATAFGDLAVLNRQAHAYLLAGQFNYTPVKIPLKEPVIIRTLPVGAAEAALIPDTIAFADTDLSLYRKEGERSRERKRRQTMLERLRSKAAQFPNDPYALFLLAEEENAVGSKQSALAVTDRLLAQQPAHAGAMALKSMLLSDLAVKASAPARAASAAEARRLAVAANKLDPDNALTYVAFYRSYAAAGQKVPASAVEGLAVAVEKLPADTAIRQMLVDQLASDGRYAEAIFTLLPIANDPHESPLRAAAREKLAALKVKAASKPAGAKGP
jgi:tetratricopeptide (TPR) repeat protein